uniref:Uncharacterized protein n=1 Tax=Spironucleus salmonicida TaxID=348837 RepID=V6LI79_9EUKA|eukprot:EST43416.1 Hypothetical protein SS50377_16877 [Spironucleus salmonicida]
MSDSFINRGSILMAIKQLVDSNTLQLKHFNNLSKDEFNQYVIDYGHIDYITQYINYCIQYCFVLAVAIRKQIEISLQEQKVNIINYLTAPAMAINLYTHNCVSQLQNGFQDLKHNKSKCKYKLSQLIQQDIQSTNKLLDTGFNQISNILYNQQFKGSRYNIDRVFTTDNKKYGLELDGTFYNGLKELSCKDEYHILQQQRLEAYNNNNQYLNSKMEANSFEQIFHVTDKQCIQFEKDNNIKIEVPKRFDITNRSILTEGRAQCFTDHMKINKKKFKMYGIDFTSLHPSAMVF